MRDYALGYTLVGGLAAGVDIGAFHGLAPHLPSVWLAAALSFGVAAAVNYMLSSLWVYRRRWDSLQRAALFLGLACVGLAVNAGVTWWLASTWPVHATLAKVGGVASAFLINFWMNTRLVFARVGASQASS